MSPEEELQFIHALIDAEQYAEARRRLKQLDHPLAADWLAHLDEIAPETASSTETAEEPPAPPVLQPQRLTINDTPKRARERRGVGVIGVLVIILLLVSGVVGAVAIAYFGNQGRFAPVTPSVTPQWELTETRFALAGQTATQRAISRQETAAVPTRTRDTRDTSTPRPTSTPVPPTEATTAVPETNQDTPEDSAESPDATPTSFVMLAVPTLTPVINRLDLFEPTLGFFRIVAPAGWVADGMIVHRGSALVSGVSVTRLPESLRTVPLEQIVEERTQSTDILSVTQVTTGERQTFVVEERDPASSRSIVTYYVKDGDGDVVVFIVAAGIPNKAALHEDILRMAATVQACLQEC